MSGSRPDLSSALRRDRRGGARRGSNAAGLHHGRFGRPPAAGPLPRRQRLRPVQGGGVAGRRPQQDRRHRADRGHAADVEEAVGLPRQDHRRLHEQREGAGGEEDSQLGRSESPCREPEHAARVGREIDLGRDQQPGREQPQRNEGAHVARQAEAPEEGARPDQVDDVVHVVAVARPLLVPHPGEGAVEAVAEPVDGEAGDDEEERRRMPARHPIGQPRPQHRGQGQGGQLVGGDPPRQSLGEPEEGLPFAGGEEAAVLAGVGSDGGIGHVALPSPGNATCGCPGAHARRAALDAGTGAPSAGSGAEGGT